MIKNVIDRHVFAGLLLVLAAGGDARAQEPLNVIVTIKPVQSIAASVMDGAGAPQLLVKGSGSPHSYSMRPSDAKALNKANVVIRVSENLESFLEKPIKSLSKSARVVTLADLPGMKLLPIREGGAFEEHKHEEGHNDHGHGHAKKASGKKHDHGHDDEHEAHDAHLWLSPDNAAAIADGLAAVFAELRPEQAGLFKANAEKLKQQLAALDEELRGRLAPIKGKPFIVFHDAYQYFEEHYGLEAAGSITVSPDRQPGAARLKAIRAKIAKSRSACVFSEPQFEPKLVATLIEGTDAKPGVLDPLGAALAEGKDQYFELMRGMAKSLNDCLAGSS
ncbi:MAG: zinc ABC transporter substrate-binding protein ZnuA [Rhodomicrobium sp.]|nr:zinc ABC transporter substrate-binding protein ZnuA [Rhodomicrobium sp.]